MHTWETPVMTLGKADKMGKQVYRNRLLSQVAWLSSLETLYTVKHYTFSLFIEICSKKILENLEDVNELLSNLGKRHTISRSLITNVPSYHSRDYNCRTT